jgi:hypothetical protein
VNAVREHEGAVMGRPDLARVPAVKDGILMVTLALALATFVTAHVALSWRLFFDQRPRWHGLVGLVVPPLAVVWALRAGWRWNATIWLGAVGVYLVAVIVAKVGAGA